MSQLITSSALSDLGRIAEATVSMQEAVSIYRRLAARDPAAGESNLALALSDYAVLLVAQDRHGEALTVLNECTSRYRALAAVNPRYRTHLARSLNNQAIQLASTGDRAAALSAAEEAAAMYRAERGAYPQYQQDLARAERTLELLRLRKEG